MIPRCSDCGDLAIVVYAVDGTSAGLCKACIRDSFAISERHEMLRRVHDAAHGHEGPGCPVCQREAAERMLWGDTTGGDRG